MLKPNIRAVYVSLLAAALPFAASCGLGTEETANPGKKLSWEKVQQQEQARKAAADKLDRTYVHSSNTFGLQLYRILQQTGEADNLLISPWSIREALGMVWQGSKGATSEEIAGGAGWNGLNQIEGAEAAKGWRSFFELPSDGTFVGISNSLWLKEGIKPLPSYQKLLESSYNGRMEQVDFTQNGIFDTAKQINEWAELETKGMLPNVVEPERIRGLTALVLNTVYFKGGWMNEFDLMQTKIKPFHLSDGKTQDVPMMSQSGSYLYLITERYEAIRLPYGQSGGYSMLIVLPKEGLTLTELLPDLQSYEEWKDELALSTGSVELPKFKARWKGELSKSLQKLGIKAAFQPGAADFSGMLGSSGTAINNVIHEVVLEVDEKGAEAAAATSIGIPSSAQAEPHEFIADRPFFLAIEETISGGWLFLGSIVKPEALE
ncbi:serpin family protein [Paenibacillus pasadenensis]|uniref:serpin family protein n=1 Tax=Paenibacillus pasadenensis TaxID=217090 RepID=UPI00203DEE29|nr:serpin family protein [Paenibacillus pasadenensis]MCM3746111.1 serpin family protein [Paenibacillus pasadenensis]